MRGRYFLYNSNSSDYTQVIQTTCGSLQSKICGGRIFFPFPDFQSRISSSFRIRADSKKHNSWASVGAAAELSWCSGWGLVLTGTLWAAAALCSCREPAMQREHQLQISLCLGNPQPGKSVDFEFFELLERHTGARSALDMVSQNFHPLLTQNMLQS